MSRALVTEAGAEQATLKTTRAPHPGARQARMMLAWVWIAHRGQLQHLLMPSLICKHGQAQYGVVRSTQYGTVIWCNTVTLPMLSYL
jgi:hypothetical protein